MSKKTKTADHDTGDADWQTQTDADTLARHAEIAQDPDRHQKAMDHLKTRASKAKDDHEKVKKLHQHVKKGLKKAFGGKGAGENFQSEKDREEAEAKGIVNEEE